MPSTTVTLFGKTYTVGERAALKALKALDTKDRAIDYARARHLSVIRAGHSLDQTVAIVTAEGIALSRTRINVLTKAYAAAPAGITADDFVTTYVKAATDENRDAGKAKREAAKAAKGEGTTVPQGNESTTRPATVADAIAMLTTLVATFGQDPAFIAAYVAGMPVPVAA